MLESTQDIIAAALAVVLFGVMLRGLWMLALYVLAPTLTFAAIVSSSCEICCDVFDFVPSRIIWAAKLLNPIIASGS